jgi:hypothetical protein
LIFNSIFISRNNALFLPKIFTMNFVEELSWRGMIHDKMPGLDEQLAKELTTAYVGIDPTAESLHIGHLVGVMMLKHFQVTGHKPIVLVGGATGMIGDPSGKSQERNHSSQLSSLLSSNFCRSSDIFIQRLDLCSGSRTGGIPIRTGFYHRSGYENVRYIPRDWRHGYYRYRGLDDLAADHHP